MLNYEDLNKYPTTYIHISKEWILSMKLSSLRLPKVEQQKIVIAQNNENIIRYLSLPLQRFLKNYHIIFLDNNQYTLRRLLDTICDFYNNYELSLQELKGLDSDDGFGYIDDAVIRIKENPEKKIYPKNIVGSLKYFENICIANDEAGDIQYLLCLGS